MDATWTRGMQKDLARFTHELERIKAFYHVSVIPKTFCTIMYEKHNFLG